MKKVINTEGAPAAVGAYSQATTNENLLFTAGQIPITPDGGVLNEEPIGIQTTQCLDNIIEIINEEGLSANDILKITIFLNDIADFEAMNEAYSTYFKQDPPARSAVEVANLPKEVGIEIEAVVSNN